MTVLVSVLGAALLVGGGTDVVGVSVLGGGAVSVTVWAGPPPGGRWCGFSPAVLVTVAGAVVDGPGVVVAGLCAGEPVASLITAYTTRASTITPIAPTAISPAGLRNHGVGGGCGSPGDGSSS